MASAAEAEYGTIFVNTQTAVPIRTTVTEMGWKQGHAAIQVDNSTAVGIAKSIHERDSNWAEKNTIRLQRMLWGP